MNLKKLIALLLTSSCATFASAQMAALDDQQMSNIRGQALLSLTQSAGTSPVDSAPLNFYKLGAEALIEINANIKRLQLGCGGANGAGGCDIDIENLSISGLNDGTDASGSPTFSGGRPSTSAQIKNPFIEFAIKNPNSLSTREMVGFRLGAQEILGLLSLGTDNVANPTDGIRSFSGYLNLAQTTGSIMTKQAKFAVDKTPNQANGNAGTDHLDSPATISALGQTTQFYTDPNNSANTGLTIPSSPATFILPQTIVNVQRRSSITLNNIPAKVDYIPLANPAGTPANDRGIFANDALFTVFYNGIGVCPLVCVRDAVYTANNGSYLSNLNVLVTSLTQNLNQIHNIPLTGSGGYLSLQKENVRWHGSNNDDIAQRGWWLSFKEPVQLGQLVGADQVEVSSVFPQVAKAVSEFLGNNPVEPDSAFGTAITGNASSTLQIDLNTYTNGAVGSANGPALLSLGSQRFRSQEIAPNCYGNLKIC